MKIAVIGGAGVRTPLLVAGLTESDLPIEQIALYDVDRARLATIGAVAAQMAARGRVTLCESVAECIAWADFVFPSRIDYMGHLSTRQYARLVVEWVATIGLDSREYGTHSMRRTKATLIYRRTKNLRAVQLLLGHAKLESTVRRLGIEVDDALEISEQTEI